MLKQVDTESTNAPHSWHQNCTGHSKCQIDLEMSPSCTMHYHKNRVCLSAILGLPFSFSEDCTLWWFGDSFMFPPTYSSALIPFTSFFTTSHHPLYSLAICSTQMSTQFLHLSISLLLSHIQKWRKFKCPFWFCPILIHLFSHFRLWGSIKDNDILGEIPQCLCLWSVWALWTSSSRVSCSLN